MNTTTAERIAQATQHAAPAIPTLQQVPLTATVDEAARLLTTGRKRIYELLCSGELKSYVRGKKRLITGASIFQHLQANIQAHYAPIMDGPGEAATSRRAKRSSKK